MFSIRVLRSKLATLLRVAAIAGLILLMISLFVPNIGVFGLTASAFQSPGTSPPDTSPPDTSPPDTSPPDTSPPDKSPPGPFKSPPGQVKPPPQPNAGGNGNGIGPVRQVDLHFNPSSMIQAPDATGRVKISGTYSENNPNWTDWPPSVEYSTNKLFCLDFEHSYSGGTAGRAFYALYLITADGARYRIQSFNPSCFDKNFNSWAIVRDIPEELLLNESVRFEIHVEIDEGMDTPDYGWDATLVLSGEDIVE